MFTKWSLYHHASAKKTVRVREGKVVEHETFVISEFVNILFRFVSLLDEMSITPRFSRHNLYINIYLY